MSVYYSQFYHRDLAGKLVPACGDRAVIRLDGRLSDWHMRCIAADECKKRGYPGFTMLKGYHLRDAKECGPYRSVEHVSDLQTISRRVEA